ncbi:MAG: sugar transferase [Gammaproteobacteria bacterium]
MTPSDPARVPPESKKKTAGARQQPLELRVVNTPSESIPAPASSRDGWRISRSSVRLFRQNVDLRMLLIAWVEFWLLAASVPLGAFLRFRGDISALRADLGPLWLESAVFALVMLGALLAMGLYNKRLDQRSVGILARVLVGLTMGGIAMAVLMFATDALRLGRATLALAMVVALVLVMVARILFVRLLGVERFTRRVVVMGAGHRAAELRSVRVRHDLRGFQVVGFLPTEGSSSAVPPEWQIQLHDNSLQKFALDNHVDEVVVAMDDRRRGLPVQELLHCRLAGVPVTDVLTFVERESGKVELNMLYPSWLIFCEGINPRGLSRVLTRLFDIVAASGLLLLASPIMLVTAFIIGMESRFKDPVLYRQEPRPERPEFVDELAEDIPFYRERHCVKPGITGWAQLCYPYGASKEDALKKLEYDLYYVKNKSILFDLMILLQTAEVILWRKGSR